MPGPSWARGKADLDGENFDVLFDVPTTPNQAFFAPSRPIRGRSVKVSGVQ